MSERGLEPKGEGAGRGDPALVFAAGAGPAAAAIDQTASYAMAEQACRAATLTPSLIVTLLALALIAAGGIFLIRSLRITSPRVDRFVAVVGLLFAGLSFLVVGAQAAAKLLLDPCWF